MAGTLREAMVKAMAKAMVKVMVREVVIKGTTHSRTLIHHRGGNPVKTPRRNQPPRGEVKEGRGPVSSTC